MDYGLHPLHGIVGYLFSLLPLSLEYSQNLMSAFFAAGAIYGLFCILREETGDPSAAVLAAAALAVSQLFWLYAVINETYSLLAFFLVLVLYLSLQWVREKRDSLLYLLAFLLGAGFANHGLMLLFFPGIIFLLWDGTLLKFMGSHKAFLALFAFLAGSSQMTVLPLFQGMSVASLFTEWAATTSGLYQTFAGKFFKLIRELLYYPLYLFYQFPTIGVFLGLYGVSAGLRNRSRFIVSTVLIWLTILLFASHYFKQRQFPMLIPTFVIFTIWMGLGISCLLKKCPAARARLLVGILFALLCLSPPLIYYGTYRLTEAMHYDLSFVRKLAYRNTYRYYLFPPKYMETGAKDYVESSFKQAKTGAIILTDFNPGMALLYGQKVLGNRKDLKILDRIDGWVHYSPNPSREILDFLRTQVTQNHKVVYLADNWEAYYSLSEIQKEFTVTQSGGPLWEVSQKTLPALSPLN